MCGVKSENSSFIVEKVLNHNTVMCREQGSNEMFMFFGKGIGFKKMEGESFERYQSNIESNMMVLSGKQSKQYRDLMSNLRDDKLADTVQMIVLEATRFFDGEINPQLQISLLDHLNFALDRQKYGIEISYPFLNEISNIYPKEYEFAKRALEFINDHLDFEFPQSELGFLVLHFHAGVSNRKVSSILIQQQIFYELLEIIEKELGERISSSSIYYNRLLVHIDYAIRRSQQNIRIQNVLLPSIKDLAPDDFKLSLKLKNLLHKKYKIELNEDEVGYLALHLNNLRNK